MFARAALFAHIQQMLFNVETIEPSGHFSHDVTSGVRFRPSDDVRRTTALTLISRLARITS
jgi:hypothetical protein